MKKLLTFAAMFLCSLTTFAQFSGSGSGTEDDPYLIFDAANLNQLRLFLNKENVYFKLMDNIDLEAFLEDENPTEGWQPVGTQSTPFKGILNGNGKTISGLWINRPSSDQVGFFGSFKGKVNNLTLKGTLVKGNNEVGFLCGNATATISDCTIQGDVCGNTNVGGCIGSTNPSQLTNISFSGHVEGVNYIGGIIGSTNNKGSFTNCKVVSDKISGTDYVGGICGANNGTQTHMTTCVVHGNISGNDRIGGICGEIQPGNGLGPNMNKCSFFGNVDANSSAGGLSGVYSCAATVKGCVAVGQVTGQGDFIGGLIGQTHDNCALYNNVTILNSYYSGSVSGLNYVGGIIGKAFNGNVKYCYANSSVSGNKGVGGLFGKIEGNNGYNLSLCSNVAIATSVKATEGNVGRIYGEKGSYVNLGAMGTAEENKAYNRAIVINAGVVQDIYDGEQNGTGVSQSTLKYKATYLGMGWDFDDIWTIQETECYPYMKTQTSTPIITSQVVSGATVVSGKCLDGGIITLEVDGVKQQLTSSNNTFSFNVTALQAGHEIRISAKAADKEESYQNAVLVSYLGKGTEAAPYQVYTAADLTCVYRRGYYKLMNDVDLTSYISQYSPTEGWESIGREGSETIHFDGDGHKITGLWCNTTRDNVGLFSCFANGTIKNLTVETATNKKVKGVNNVGILVGKLINGQIEKCKVIGVVEGNTPVGGILGLLDGGSIKLSQASVTINSATDESYVGGLVGIITSGEIEQCVTQGKITATGGATQSGGLVGKNYATISNCYSNMEVDSKWCSAGIVAYNYGLVEKCYAAGNLKAYKYAAGIIGYNDGENAIVRYCVAMNNKISIQKESSGGYGQRIIGGFKATCPEPELNNYALNTMQLSDENNIPKNVQDNIMNGVAKTGSELMTEATYVELGWDFFDCWTIATGEGYPSLMNNTAEVYQAPDEEEEPEIVVSTTDVISVAPVTAVIGETLGVGINIENQTTDLTAYQFDLILPPGITIAKNDNDKYLVTKTNRYSDEDQSLNISLVDENTYRFVCFSMTNGVIEGTTGAILNAMFEIDKNVHSGTHVAYIKNIIFTQVSGAQFTSNDITFNIKINDVIKGDANGDKNVNVSDIVEMVNYIMNNASSRFVKVAADVNEDGDVNVTDIVAVVNIILNTTTNNARAVTRAENTDNDQLTLAVNADKSVSLMLDNNANYVASQFELMLAEGQQLNSITLNSNRCSGHIMSYSKIANNKYRVMIYSLDNSSYTGNSGELVNINVEGEGEFVIDKILFVTKGQAEKYFSSIGGNGTTGIGIINAEDVNNDIYTIDGRLVRSKANNTSGLAKGVYIINGKKHVVK